MNRNWISLVCTKNPSLFALCHRDRIAMNLIIIFRSFSVMSFCRLFDKWDCTICSQQIDWWSPLVLHLYLISRNCNSSVWTSMRLHNDCVFSYEWDNSYVCALCRVCVSFLEWNGYAWVILCAKKCSSTPHVSHLDRSNMRRILFVFSWILLKTIRSDPKIHTSNDIAIGWRIVYTLRELRCSIGIDDHIDMALQ